jgi:hypothetical protein
MDTNIDHISVNAINKIKNGIKDVYILKLKKITHQNNLTVVVLSDNEIDIKGWSKTDVIASEIKKCFQNDLIKLHD